MSSIVEIINHYQKSIDRSLNDEARLVHCIGKLYRLPVSVQHLQETGIGRTVNGLRKYDGEVGVAAKALVTKWKNMVAAEESDTGEPEPQHQNQEEEEEDEDNYDESCLQVDEDRQSDDQQDEEAQADEDDEDQHQQEEESDNQEEDQTPQVSYNTDSDHRSSHRDSEQHRSSSSSKHKGDRHSHHSSSSSKDEGRSRERHEKHRDEKKKHHSSSTSSSKGHSSSPSSSSSKKSHRHENEEKDKKEKHSSRKESSHSNGKESSHSKDKTSTSEKHSSKYRENLNGLTKDDKSHKRKRTSEDEEESDVKKVKDDKPSESKSKSSGKSSSSSKDRSSSSKSSSSSGSNKEKDKKHSSEKKKDSSSKRKSAQSTEDVDNDDEDSSGGASFADALAMIGMPSSSKKKSSNKASIDKIKTSSSSMPPPPAKSDKTRSANSNSCSATPTLLAQKPKMAPLPIAEIVESLPMISPNYKPMPLNQTVMECVFSNNGKPQKRPMTEEEALGHSMQSKNIRTKVYSGVKSYNGEVPTLYNLCIRLLQEHIDLIDYTGGIPFDLLKPVLDRASPEQLCTLENYNPYLMEDSDVLWEQHCKRNFRSQKRKEEECESWREMYIRCSEERESKLLSLTANIKQSQVAKTAPIRKTQLAYVDSAVKPPRNVISKQARYGTAQAPVVSPAARVASLKNATTNVAKAGDTRLKVAAGVRDTAQAQVFHPTKPKKAPLMSKVMQSIKGFKGFRR